MLEERKLYHWLRLKGARPGPSGHIPGLFFSVLLMKSSLHVCNEALVGLFTQKDLICSYFTNAFCMMLYPSAQTDTRGDGGGRTGTERVARGAKPLPNLLPQPRNELQLRMLERVVEGRWLAGECQLGLRLQMAQAGRRTTVSPGQQRGNVQ